MSSVSSFSSTPLTLFTQQQSTTRRSTPAPTVRSTSTSIRSSRSGTGYYPRIKSTIDRNEGSTVGSKARQPKISGPTSSKNSDGGFLAAIVEGRGTGAEVGMCFCDLKTSEVILCQLTCFNSSPSSTHPTALKMADSQTYVRTLQKLSLFEPSEILMPTSAVDPVNTKLVKIVKESLPSSTITPVARRLFNDSTGLQYIKKYTIKEGSASLLLGIPTKYFCLAATAAVMHHIEEKRNATFLNHSVQFKYQICQGSMVLDCATAKNLELTVNLSSQNEKETLFGILNETMTPMGARLLRSNILQPLTDERTISTRLDCVQELSQVEETFYALKSSLKALNDVDHLITSFIQVPTKPSVKHSEQGINHIINLKHTLKSIAHIAQVLGSCQNRLLKTIHRLLTDSRLEKFQGLIDDVIEKNVVLEKTAVGLRNQRCFAVKAGCNGLLDVARQTYKETINDIFEVVNRYVEDYDINLKVQFNTTMGYYLSTNVNQPDGGELPLIFINVVRKSKMLTFTTLELMKKNAKIKDSLTEVYLMSDKIVGDLSGDVRLEIGALYKASEAIAMLDMLISFSHLCTVNDYVRPEFTDTLVIKQGRHPIIEKLYSAPFVPNDTYAGSANTFQIITGPNMSGKSTYLRQIALLTIMAQIGSFIPAEYASIRIIDQLFSRISNDDSIELNASTFMVEMKETAYILQSVTERSLVVIDELGRGLSLAKTLNLPEDITTRAEEISFSLTDLQEKARRQSDSNKVVARRRALAQVLSLYLAYWEDREGCIQSLRIALDSMQIAHDVELVRKSSVHMSHQDLVLALRAAQQEAISKMLAIRDIE
ncbi:MutS protein msh4 [Dissophora ornata]|nr:MutS protein msh4 [Dissophora ornata]